MFEYMYEIVVGFGFWILSTPYYIVAHAIISILIFVWLVKYRAKVNKYIHLLVTLIFILLNAFYLSFIVTLLVGGLIMMIGVFVKWLPYIISSILMYVSLAIVYIVFLVGLILNNRSLFTTKSSLFFSIRYLLQIIIVLLLFSPILLYFNYYDSYHPGDMGLLPQVCLSAGESVGCKMYNKNGMDDEVVLWCEDIYYVGSTRDVNGEFIYMGWEDEKRNWDEISKRAYEISTSENKVLKISASKTSDNLEKVDTVTKGTIDAIYPCINPSKGGYVFVIED
jgi:hypothetical protein